MTDEKVERLIQSINRLTLAILADGALRAASEKLKTGTMPLIEYEENVNRYSTSTIGLVEEITEDRQIAKERKNYTPSNGERS